MQDARETRKKVKVDYNEEKVTAAKKEVKEVMSRCHRCFFPQHPATDIAGRLTGFKPVRNSMEFIKEQGCCRTKFLVKLVISLFYIISCV